MSRGEQGLLLYLPPVQIEEMLKPSSVQGGGDQDPTPLLGGTSPPMHSSPGRGLLPACRTSTCPGAAAACSPLTVTIEVVDVWAPAHPLQHPPAHTPQPPRAPAPLLVGGPSCSNGTTDSLGPSISVSFGFYTFSPLISALGRPHTHTLCPAPCRRMFAVGGGSRARGN